MSLYRLTYDIDALATALLPLFKMHSFIERPDQEAQAKEVLARVIGRIERQSGICIAPATYTWMPRDPTSIAYSEATPPQFWREVLVPLRGFTALTGKDAADVALTYRMRGDVDQLSFGRVWVNRQPAGMQPSDLWTITAGFATPEEMPAELRDTVIRYAAALWENREAWGNHIDTVPEWVNEALGIFWVPEV